MGPEDLDDEEGWEREKQHIINPDAKQHIINPDAKVAPRPPKKKIDTSVAPEARSGDGTLSNVGVRLTGTLQCKECRQKFDTERALGLHWKFIHDPNRHQED